MTKELWNKLVISKLASKIGQSWKGTDQINLTEFYAKTRPQYIVAHCMLEYIDCRRLWAIKSESKSESRISPSSIHYFQLRKRDRAWHSIREG